MTRCIRKIALSYLSRAIKITPVDTGYLRRGWILEEGTEMPTENEIKQFIKNIKVIRNGIKYEITLANNVEYALYVNDGHEKRKKKGNNDNNAKKDDKKDKKENWVEGKFFLEKLEDFMNEKRKKRLTQTEINNFFKRYFENNYDLFEKDFEND